MAIRIITGIPGSGKSYYAVKHLRDNYCEKLSGVWSLKEDFTVISNIDSLKIDHLNLSDILKKANITIEKFFTVPYQESIRKKYPKIIYFIDEAQQFFGRRFRNEETFFYFQYHRHLGDDVYLMTQDIRLLPVEITSLCETEMRACRRSLSLFGELKYLVKSNGEIVDRKTYKKDKSVFDLYCSQTANETEKIKNPLVKYLVIAFVCMIVCFILFKRTFFSKWGVEKAHASNNISESVNNEKKKIVKFKDYESKSSKVEHKKNVSNQEHIDYKWIKLSYCILGKSLKIVDPFSGQIIPSQSFHFPLRATGRSLYAKIPSSHFPHLFQTGQHKPDLDRSGLGEHQAENVY